MGQPQSIKKSKVFLGGTAATSTWRKDLIPLLEIDYFNPQLGPGEWNDNSQLIEDREKNESDYNLYVLTAESASPFTLFEIGQDTKSKGKKVVFCYLEEANGQKLEEHQIKVFKKISTEVRSHGGVVYTSLADVAKFLNEN